MKTSQRRTTMQGNALIALEDGAYFDLGGGVGVTIKITGDSTGGRFAVVEHPVEPGGLVEPHTHTKEDEYSYVLEGEIGVQIGEEVLTAPAGSLVYKPRGLEHAFWNAGPAPARILEIISPAGFEHFFEETVGLVAPDGSFDEEGFVKLAERYGMLFAFEKAPELVEKYDLRRDP
jgi:quercetin dioxygenase-like cupin family protein